MNDLLHYHKLLQQYSSKPAKALDTPASTPEATAPPQPAVADRMVATCTTFILENLHVPIRISDLELLTGWNRFKLQDAFRKVYGTTVYQFVIHQRIAQARRYLKETNWSIQIIAGRLGYSTFQFIKIFKQQVGTTPGNYRRAV